MSIRNWPAAERPREKLLELGAASLSDAELLAIFLRTGVLGKSVVDLARHLLGQFGSLRSLLEARQWRPDPHPRRLAFRDRAREARPRIPRL